MHACVISTVACARARACVASNQSFVQAAAAAAAAEVLHYRYWLGYPPTHWFCTLTGPRRFSASAVEMIFCNCQPVTLQTPKYLRLVVVVRWQTTNKKATTDTTIMTNRRILQ